jgi:hypothetical protein
VPVGHNGNQSIAKSVEAWKGWASWDKLSATAAHKKGAASLLGTARLKGQGCFQRSQDWQFGPHGPHGPLKRRRGQVSRARETVRAA